MAAESSALVQRPSGRSFLLDLLKALACVLIVLNHLAFYGPMSDVVMRSWPVLINGLYDHGRLAVQIFLVCAGFLTASSLQKKHSLGWRQAGLLALQRYWRLTIPYLAALSLTVLVTEGLRPVFNSPTLSATPGWAQALAHVFLAEHLLGMPSLSAGVWYVAIDFQLYVIALLSLLLVNRFFPQSVGLPFQGALWKVWLVLSLLSLIVWSLNDDLDIYGLYFFGAYGLGLLAFRARQSRLPWKAWAVLIGVGLLALWVDPRWRVTTAWGVALLLAAVSPQWWPRWWPRWFSRVQWPRAVRWMSQISYSVFLIHYAIIMLVSAFVTAYWPDDLLANGLGMLLALALAVAAGSVLFRLVEQPAQDGRHWALWVGVFMVSVALTLHMSA